MSPCVRLTGLVTAGGRSTRMGTDKGLLQTNGMPWCMAAREKLLGFCHEAYVSISLPQYQSYLQLINPNHLLTDDPDLHGMAYGPMRAVVTASRNLAETDLLILGCDMTDMRPETIGKLVRAYKSHPGYSFYAFSTPDGPEPLCAIYKADALKTLWEEPAPSLRQLLLGGSTFSIRPGSSCLGSFRNRNYPWD